MVNPDSDLYRAHPDWALVDHRLRAGARSPPTRPRPHHPRRLRRDPRPPRRAARRPRHRLRQVGHEPRPRAGHRRRRAGRHARADAGPVPAARRAAPAPPRRRVRELLVGRGAHRPRHPAADRAGVDERLQRRPRAPDDPAPRLDADPAGGDGRPHRAADRAHDRSHPDARVPGGDGAVRPLRHRVEPAARSTTTSSPSWPPGSSCTSATATCSTAATSCASTTTIRTPTSTACSPPTGAAR